ncbi:hypothetical protein AABB24_018692 [Solanum stoloniferum]|uniref:Uncharacterized protein n=1 Tax=Solanum stoloniferum TaxID=62892 RepID=A0ABD2TDG9_9SOLN
MLLIGAKFAEIVKIGEIIEDGLKTGKIARVATRTESLRLLKKKREDVTSISYVSMKKDTSKNLHFTMVILKLHKIHIQLLIPNHVIKLHLRVTKVHILFTKLHRHITKIPTHITKLHQLIVQISSQVTKLHLHITKIPLLATELRNT